MKSWSVVLFALIAVQFGLADATEKVYRDENGMPRCIEAKDSVLIVWDSLIQRSSRPVFGITLKDYSKANAHQIKHCKDWRSAVKWPEGLSLISDFESSFTQATRFALVQLKDGGTVLRDETSAFQFVNNRTKTFSPGSSVDVESMQDAYGSRFADEIVTSWIRHLQHRYKMSPARCDQWIGTCEYYLCLESTQNCGVSGYPVGFGYKYCDRSLNGLYQAMATPQSKAWVLNTVQCLQTQIAKTVSSSSLTCPEVEESALNSHPKCYVDSGFCTLPLTEQLKIFNVVKAELLKGSSISQASKTLTLCGRKFE